MTHYEEFGIPTLANTEDIRHAHRRLIKILHPDLQTEEIARQLAETQTRRINGIAEILLDPVKRHRYNLTLECLPKPWVSQESSWTAGAALAAILLACVLWRAQSDWSTAAAQPTAAEPPQSISSRHPPDSSRTTPKSSDAIVGMAKPERGTLSSNAQAPPVEHHGDGASLQIALPRQEPDQQRSNPPDRAPDPAASGRVPTQNESPNEEACNPFVGTWIYVPVPVTDQNRQLYRPEYIEMRIRDVKGTLEGQYRARYHVPDRPLSPSVGFHFAGKPGSSPVALRWDSSSGLAGQVEMKLMSANSLQVDWRVTEMAASADLVSGTAILTRVQ